jgi:hypothetical protein
VLHDGILVEHRSDQFSSKNHHLAHFAGRSLRDVASLQPTGDDFNLEGAPFKTDSLARIAYPAEQVTADGNLV